MAENGVVSEPKKCHCGACRYDGNAWFGDFASYGPARIWRCRKCFDELGKEERLVRQALSKIPEPEVNDDD